MTLHSSISDSSISDSWTDLDELRNWAFRQGFTQDQFGYAVNRVGSDPHEVASELQRHLFMAALQDQCAAD